MDDVPVLIVGGGPAGLTASLLLSRHGVESLLVERYATASPLPRARGVHARAMEILRVCGVEEDMRRAELPIRPGAEWRPTLTGPLLNEMNFGSDEPEVSPSDGVAVSQDVFEAVIREHARSQDRAELRLGTEMESFSVLGDSVRAVLRDRGSGERSTVRARYLIAADGYRSGIREQLGIGLDGEADLGGQGMISFRADLTGLTGGRPRGIYFLTSVSAALFWTHPDHRWVLSTPDQGEPEGDFAAAGAVRAALGTDDVPIEVLAARRWTAAAQTATAFAQGPVFLVGDAAHRVPPAGATGVSTAMHDVYNLAWKLAYVLAGRAGPGLLDTYGTERRPVARDTGEEMLAVWRNIWAPGHGAPTGRSMRELDMGYRYRSDAVIDDGTPPPADALAAAPGGRAPHLWLDTPGGRISSIDLFDRDCVLLTGPEGAAWQSAAADLGERVLSGRVIGEGEWPALYGVGAAGAVLVRPDGHIAWRRPGGRSAEEPAEAEQLRGVLAGILDR